LVIFAAAFGRCIVVVVVVRFLTATLSIALVLFALAAVPLFGELLVPQEFRVHPPGRHVPRLLGLLDAVPVGLLRVVVRARVLLLF